MKKALLFSAFLLIALLSTLQAQNTGQNKKPIANNQKEQPKPVPWLKRKYSSSNTGVAIPLGAFGNKDHTMAIHDAGGANAGTLFEYSTLHIFGTQSKRTFYPGLQTMLTLAVHPIQYEPAERDLFSGYRAFPTAEFKLGPAIAFPVTKGVVLDLNANIGVAMTVPLHVGYIIYLEEIYPSYVIESTDIVYVDQAVAFGAIGGIGGHARFGRFLIGVDLNLGKFKLNVVREYSASTYSRTDGFLIKEDLLNYSGKDKMHINALRFKFGFAF